MAIHFASDFACFLSFSSMAKDFSIIGGSKMGINFGYVVLAIFIIIRLLIAIGVFYLIVTEFRRFGKRNRMKEEGEGDKHADRKGIRRHAD
jgi:hypothetical protein